MLAWFQSHPLVAVALAVLVAGLVVSLVRAGVLALHAWRQKQVAAADDFAARAKLAAIDTVTAFVAQVVLSYEREVRDRKDPSKPEAGTWNPLTDGPRILQAVVGDVWKLGGDAVATLRQHHGLTVDEATELLAKIAEAQVQKLRASSPKPAAPAEMAALVAEILRDPASVRTTLPGPAPARVLVTAEGLAAVGPAEGAFDPTKRQPIAPEVVDAARAATDGAKG